MSSIIADAASFVIPCNSWTPRQGQAVDKSVDQLPCSESLRPYPSTCLPVFVFRRPMLLAVSVSPPVAAHSPLRTWLSNRLHYLLPSRCTLGCPHSVVLARRPCCGSGTSPRVFCLFATTPDSEFALGLLSNEVNAGDGLCKSAVFVFWPVQLDPREHSGTKHMATLPVCSLTAAHRQQLWAEWRFEVVSEKPKYLILAQSETWGSEEDDTGAILE